MAKRKPKHADEQKIDDIDAKTCLLSQFAANKNCNTIEESRIRTCVCMCMARWKSRNPAQLILTEFRQNIPTPLRT